ncbi:MAG TPA: MBL fold metallo-hydrolase [Candidatus Acidoferrales bacterium]|nr:MBL fold metallo-hydrolase [Candidatus Acidoferrales bacterium]
MHFTVLGSSCSAPRPGRACSGYLVEAGASAVVLDFGSGVLANLVLERPADTIDAIVITHMHSDHFLDLITLRYALKYGSRSNDRKIALLLPPGGEAILRGMVEPLSDEPAGDFFAAVCHVSTYDPLRSLRIGDLQLRFAPTVHSTPTYAIRCEAASSLTYSADTGLCAPVEELARGTDLFLCEATLVLTHSGAYDHCRPEDAGAMAERAAARRLLLTHYSSEISETELQQRARSAYSGDLAVADDHLQLEVA